ncbi:hypothetical protein B0H66DRAFT_34418 [Apodospora peruviana]|uniref:Secreted protein n=1 Tax=Apodospora peruviana TaxID=516989 RepID=A0AAE0IR38_9PEZI|nr:hypothetical protein B0H66DRAFT_34418 [Apodospora peruviana]
MPPILTFLFLTFNSFLLQGPTHQHPQETHELASLQATDDCLASFFPCSSSCECILRPGNLRRGLMGTDCHALIVHTYMQLDPFPITSPISSPESLENTSGQGQDKRVSMFCSLHHLPWPGFGELFCTVPGYIHANPIYCRYLASIVFVIS